MGIKPVFKLTTKDGKSIRTTGNHPYLVKAEDRIEERGVCLTEPGINPEHLTEDYEFSETQAIWKLSFSVGEDNHKVNQQYKTGSNVKDGFVHNGLLLFSGYPEQNDQSQDTSKNVEGQKIHDLVKSSLDNFMAITKNKQEEKNGLFAEKGRNHSQNDCHLANSDANHPSNNVGLELREPSFNFSLKFSQFLLKAAFSHFQGNFLSACFNLSKDINQDISAFITQSFPQDSRYRDYRHFSLLGCLNHTIRNLSCQVKNFPPHQNPCYGDVLAQFIGQANVYASIPNYIQDVNADWLKVIYLTEGDEICLTEGDEICVFNDQRPMTNDPYVLWARVAKIEYIGYEQVYDIEVEGTHNFIANGIVAHNTYLNGNVGIGTTAPGSKLSVSGGGSFGSSYAVSEEVARQHATFAGHRSWVIGHNDEQDERLLTEEGKQDSSNSSYLAYPEDEHPRDNIGPHIMHFNSNLSNFFGQPSFKTFFSNLDSSIFCPFFSLVDQVNKGLRYNISEFFPQDIRYSNHSHFSLLGCLNHTIRNILCQVKKEILCFHSPFMWGGLVQFPSPFMWGGFREGV